MSEDHENTQCHDVLLCYGFFGHICHSFDLIHSIFMLALTTILSIIIHPI